MNHMDHHHNHRRKKEYESSCLTKLGCTYQTTKNPKLQKHKRVDVDENLDENDEIQRKVDAMSIPSDLSHPLELLWHKQIIAGQIDPIYKPCRIISSKYKKKKTIMNPTLSRNKFILDESSADDSSSSSSCDDDDEMTIQYLFDNEYKTHCISKKRLIPFHGISTRTNPPKNERHLISSSSRWCKTLCSTYTKQREVELQNKYQNHRKSQIQISQMVQVELKYLEKILQYTKSELGGGDDDPNNDTISVSSNNTGTYSFNEQNSFELEEPYTQALGRPMSNYNGDDDDQSNSSNSSMDLNFLKSHHSHKPKEPIRPGDVIVYYSPMFVWGDKRGRREATILSIDPDNSRILELDNGEYLPKETRVCRVKVMSNAFSSRIKNEKNHQQEQASEMTLIDHPGVFREIQEFKLKKYKHVLPKCGNNNIIQTEAQRVQTIIQKNMQSFQAKALKDNFAPLDLLHNYRGIAKIDNIHRLQKHRVEASSSLIDITNKTSDAGIHNTQNNESDPRCKNKNKVKSRTRLTSISSSTSDNASSDDYSKHTKSSSNAELHHKKSKEMKKSLKIQNRNEFSNDNYIQSRDRKFSNIGSLHRNSKEKNGFLKINDGNDSSSDDIHNDYTDKKSASSGALERKASLKNYDGNRSSSDDSNDNYKDRKSSDTRAFHNHNESSGDDSNDDYRYRKSSSTGALHRISKERTGSSKNHDGNQSSSDDSSLLAKPYKTLDKDDCIELMHHEEIFKKEVKHFSIKKVDRCVSSVSKTNGPNQMEEDYHKLRSTSCNTSKTRLDFDIEEDISNSTNSINSKSRGRRDQIHSSSESRRRKDLDGTISKMSSNYSEYDSSSSDDSLLSKPYKTIPNEDKKNDVHFMKQKDDHQDILFVRSKRKIPILKDLDSTITKPSLHPLEYNYSSSDDSLLSKPYKTFSNTMLDNKQVCENKSINALLQKATSDASESILNKIPNSSVSATRHNNLNSEDMSDDDILLKKNPGTSPIKKSTCTWKNLKSKMNSITKPQSCKLHTYSSDDNDDADYLLLPKKRSNMTELHCSKPPLDKLQRNNPSVYNKSDDDSLLLNPSGASSLRKKQIMKSINDIIRKSSQSDDSNDEDDMFSMQKPIRLIVSKQEKSNLARSKSDCDNFHPEDVSDDDCSLMRPSGTSFQSNFNYTPKRKRIHKRNNYNEHDIEKSAYDMTSRNRKPVTKNDIDDECFMYPSSSDEESVEPRNKQIKVVAREVGRQERSPMYVKTPLNIKFTR